MVDEKFIYISVVYGSDYRLELVEAEDREHADEIIENTMHNFEHGILVPLEEFKKLLKSFEEEVN